jgi:hypothetical protein
VDPDVVQFLRDHISSIAALELLLLLAQDRRSWTATEVNRELRSDEHFIGEHLAYFAQVGMLRLVAERPRTYEFAPTRPGDSELIRRLGDAYRNVRIRVIEEIYPPASR